MQKGKTWLFVSIGLVLTLSLITIWSTVPSLFYTQLSFALIGALIVFLLSKTDIYLLFSLSGFLYFLSIFLLIITFVFGKNIRGSIRWIDFGFFNLQTSEIVKPLLAIFYSSYLSTYPPKKIKDILFFLFLAAIPVVLVARQPDLGSALTLMFLPVSLLAFIGHLKKILVVSVVFLAIAIPLESRLLKPYQRERLETFVNPYRDPKGAGYNVIQATIAVGSGGIWGKGVKLGTQSHLNFLPERHTDFIFASFAEEFGLIGIIFLFLSYINIFRYSLYSAKVQRDIKQSLMAFSLFAVCLFQFTVNIGMNLGIMPVTGITLPIFSYGGSSLLSFAIFLGILVRQLDLIPPIEI